MSAVEIINVRGTLASGVTETISIPGDSTTLEAFHALSAFATGFPSVEKQFWKLKRQSRYREDEFLDTSTLGEDETFECIVTDKSAIEMFKVSTVSLNSESSWVASTPLATLLPLHAKNSDDATTIDVQVLEANNISFHIKTLTGKELHIALSDRATVLDLKENIQDKEGIPPDQQRVIFAGYQLEDDLELAHYGVTNGSMLHLVLRLRGGMFAEPSGRAGDFEDISITSPSTGLPIRQAARDESEPVTVPLFVRFSADSVKKAMLDLTGINTRLIQVKKLKEYIRMAVSSLEMDKAEVFSAAVSAAAGASSSS